jgi:SAM-dependent methyltransferase
LSDEDLLRLTQRVAATWRSLGEERPHWSVLSNAQFLPQNIETEQGAFHASGASDVEQLLAIIRHVGRDPDEFASILEYGCGLGRMTNHFARRFPTVTACDISASHIDLARAHSGALGLANITYREITAPDFGMTGPIDLWYSAIVLQHNPPPVMASILRRMLHQLRPGGVAVFQAPTYEPNYRFKVSEYLDAPEAEGLEMHIIPQGEVFRLVREAGCSVYDVLEDSRAGPERLSNLFVIGK